MHDGKLDVAAGTAWLWARAGMAGSVDTLFVDEAGQLPLAGVLAVAGAARNLILLGDPQQLAQPSHATHPPGAGASALEHILGGRATMPAAAGLLDFLYDPHRLNVATSRARALAIIVASPDLIRVSCRTPDQMVLANALCRAWEAGG